MNVYSLNNDVMNACELTTQPEYFEALVPSPPELAVAFIAFVICCHKNATYCLKTPQTFISLSRAAGCTNLDWAWWGGSPSGGGLSEFGSRLQAGCRSAPHVSHPTGIRVYLVNILLLAAP